MKGILWYVTRKLEGIFDGILMEFRMRISEDKNQTQKSMYIPRFLSSGLYGRLILGPIHPNQVMGRDPVGSHHGTRNSRSIYINPTYPYQSHD